MTDKRVIGYKLSKALYKIQQVLSYYRISKCARKSYLPEATSAYNSSDARCIVFMPVYNGERFVEQAIKSVLTQDFQGFRMYIIDDASIDRSVEIIQKLASDYPDKINFTINENNMGVGFNLNSVLSKLPDIDYFAMLGHDDMWEINFLSTQMAYLESTNHVASFSRYVCIDCDGQRIKRRRFAQATLGLYNKDTLFLRLLEGNFLCAPSAVVKIARIKPDKLAGYVGYSNDRLQDYALWLNLSLVGTFGYNTNTCVRYRLHSNNLSDETKRVQQEKMEFYSTLRQVFSSDGFKNWIAREKEPNIISDHIIDTLAHKSLTNGFLFVILSDFCEWIHLEGYASNKAINTLRKIYMSNRILGKCLHNGGTLPRKILVKILKDKDTESFFQQIKGSKNLEVHLVNDHEAPDIGFFVIPYCKLPEYLNVLSFSLLYTERRVVVLVDKSESIKIPNNFQHILFYDVQEIHDFEREIISYTEDCEECAYLKCVQKDE